MKHKKGQVTVWGLLSLLMVFVVFAATIPVIQDQINNATATMGAGTASTMLSLAPLFLVIGIIAGIFFYSSAQY